jgi:hypothetical protein
MLWKDSHFLICTGGVHTYRRYANSTPPLQGRVPSGGGGRVLASALDNLYGATQYGGQDGGEAETIERYAIAATSLDLPCVVGGEPSSPRPIGRVNERR